MPRYLDKIPPFPDFIFQFNGAELIDQVTARWVFKAASDKTFTPTPLHPQPPLPEAILEIYQSHDAGPAYQPVEAIDETVLPLEDITSPLAEDEEQEPEFNTALAAAAAALTDAGWKHVDTDVNKDFYLLYFQPPESKAWKPSRRLFHLNDINAVGQEPPPPKRRRRRQPRNPAPEKG